MSRDVNAKQTTPLLVFGSLGIVSTLVCASAVTLTFVYGLHRKLVYRLALYQALGSLMHSVLLTLQLVFLNYGDGPLCQTVAYFYNSSHWFKLLALIWVTFHLFLYSVCYKNCKKLEIPLVIMLVILPFVLSAVPFATSTYGKTPPLWCWILRYNSSDPIWPGRLGMQLVSWLIPATALLLVATVLVSVTLSVLAVRICRELRGNKVVAIGPLKRALKQMCPLMSYPVAFVFLLAFSLTFAIVGDVNPKSSALLPLTYLTAISIPMWSISSGVTLIVAIFCYRCEKRKAAPPRRQEVAYGALCINPPVVQP